MVLTSGSEVGIKNQISFRSDSTIDNARISSTREDSIKQSSSCISSAILSPRVLSPLITWLKEKTPFLVSS